MDLSKLSVHTEWGALQEIVVGNCYQLSDFNIDKSFELFFLKNIQDILVQKSFALQKRLVEQRQEDLDGLATFLEARKIKVFRPEKLEKVDTFKTPYFEGFTTPVDNPRDQSLIIGDMIIETPCQWRRRYFENDLMKPIFNHYFHQGARWFSAPRPTMRDEAFDFSQMPWEENEGLRKRKNNENQFEMMFDGAQCLKFGRDIVMNISTKNHELGAKWLESILGEDYRLHLVNITDHHIDGMFMPLRPGVCLINATTMEDKIKELPKELQKWNFIKVPLPHDEKSEGNLLASQNINVNVLPLSEKELLLFSHDGNPDSELSDLLEKNDFNTHTIRLRHSRMFGGGLHCATLDTVRSGERECYF